ncbi:hypothetical protein H072_10991 [Dactylellina haptotyla CBS 200.50]|uniref:F-box domain-containing protein n=1 Tax=Dactylellina haptotyla (strain CBS 200.50) TaxID=1284197 RepID=S7ZXV0_DACHA|nr:hypothetical protein H072_10991 [Dactylellina haptotyla CBS 200.50]
MPPPMLQLSNLINTISSSLKAAPVFRGRLKLERLPVEVHLQILSFLSFEDQFRCSVALPVWHNILLAHGRDVIFIDTRYGNTEHGGLNHPKIAPVVISLSPIYLGHHAIFGYRWCELQITLGKISSVTFYPKTRITYNCTFLPTPETVTAVDPNNCYIMNDLLIPPRLQGFRNRAFKGVILQMSIATYNRPSTRAIREWEFYQGKDGTDMTKLTVMGLLELVSERAMLYDEVRELRRVRLRFRAECQPLEYVHFYVEILDLPDPPTGVKRLLRRFI